MDKDYKEKLSHLNDLLLLARAEGNMDDQKTEFIARIADYLGVEPVDLSRLTSGELAIEFTPSSSEFERIEQFQRLLLMSAFNISGQGEGLGSVRDLGLRLGLNPYGMEEMISQMVCSENYIVPANQILRIFTKYHN